MIPGIEKEEVFCEVQNLLFEYLYGGADGVSYLMCTICEKYFGGDDWKREEKRNYELDMLKSGNFRNVRKNFREDLYKLLKHRFFRNLDFYKRYDYLATLLDFYVIQFVINKRLLQIGDMCCVRVPAIYPTARPTTLLVYRIIRKSVLCSKQS